MLIIRLIIYLAPLFLLYFIGNLVIGKKMRKDLRMPEFVSVVSLTLMGVTVYVEFLLLMFHEFGWSLIISSLVLATVILFLLKILILYFFPDKNTHQKYNNKINPQTVKFLKYLFIVSMVWYASVATKLFNNPAFWWDEIIHWIPKAKALIQSGNFSELNLIPITEYPRLWPIILASFMIVQDKLTHTLPLILYYFYWIFAVSASLRNIKVKSLFSHIPLALVISGAFINIGWGAPYSDLPFSVFYCTALILMYLIIGKFIQWKNILYVGLLLGTICGIRPEGIIYALGTIVIFFVVTLFSNRENSIKSLIYMTLVVICFYLPWQFYLKINDISNDISKQAIIGFWENWNNRLLVLDKIIKILDFAWMHSGKISSPYFLLALSPIIACIYFLKNREPEIVFGVLILLANFMIVFLVVLFSPTLTGGFGGLSFWLGANFTRFTNHYLPFTFFIVGNMLYRLQVKKQV